jgi:hypothetical protein
MTARTSVAVKSLPSNSKGLGERVGRAIAEIERRFWIDAFPVPIKRDGGGARLNFVEGNDLDIVVRQQAPKFLNHRLVVTQAQNARGLVRVDGGK